MNGFDWGKLIARLFAIWLFSGAFERLYYAWVMTPSDEFDKYFWLYRLSPLLPVAASIVLWVFAGRLVARDLEDGDRADAARPASVLVAALATFFAIDYGYSFMATLVEKGQEQVGREIPHHAIWFYLVVSVGFLLVVANARRVALWISR